ncbi:MAG TPA: hypothetical protein VKB80_08190 [Kofleriaceae bacterium]|nr:hypothetical protein [Kofleriaceae bacterium]
MGGSSGARRIAGHARKTGTSGAVDEVEHEQTSERAVAPGVHFQPLAGHVEMSEVVMGHLVGDDEGQAELAEAAREQLAAHMDAPAGHREGERAGASQTTAVSSGAPDLTPFNRPVARTAISAAHPLSSTTKVSVTSR